MILRNVWRCYGCGFLRCRILSGRCERPSSSYFFSRNLRQISLYTLYILCAVFDPRTTRFSNKFCILFLRQWPRNSSCIPPLPSPELANRLCHFVFLYFPIPLELLLSAVAGVFTLLEQSWMIHNFQYHLVSEHISCHDLCYLDFLAHFAFIPSELIQSEQCTLALQSIPPLG